MKKIMMVVVMASLLLAASIAGAATKDIGVVPQLSGDTVTLNIPQGITNLVVYVYDDAAQKPPVQYATPSFPVLQGQGFNYQYTDSTGSYWQLVTQQSATGTGITIDCGHEGGCKYIRPVVR